MTEDRVSHEVAPRGPGEVDPVDPALTPIEGPRRDIERFSSGPAAHSAGLTEERSAQIVRQSASARNVAFMAIMVIALFIPVYWFYESGVPALGAEGRMAAETRRLSGGDEVVVAPVTHPGTPESPRTVRLTLTDALAILGEDGGPVSALAVSEGETIRFEVENTAGFPHNVYVGVAEDLAANQTGGLPGVPAWSSGTRTFDWVATADGPLRFACTVPGHYTSMNGRLAFES